MGNVISALSDELRKSNAHVPYRDSKLTRLLQGKNQATFRDMKKRFGFLDGLEVSIDGLDILLFFFNSLDIFTESMLVFLEQFTVMRINASLF